MQKKGDTKIQNDVGPSKKQQELKHPNIFQQKRISITSFMNSLPQPQKPKEKNHGKELTEKPLQQSRVEEKDRMIKELQEEILEKKLRNDMIQDAFNRRHESQQNLSNYSCFLKVLTDGCKILAAADKSFKKNVFRTVMGVLKAEGKIKGKGVKLLLIWMISWITHLFTFLSSTLIKK